MRIERHSSVASRLPGGAANPEYYRLYYAEHGERIRSRNRARAKIMRYKSRLDPAEYRRMVVALLLQRDGGVCGICGLSLDGDTEIDHIVQRALGGDSGADNIRLVHSGCNRSRPKKGRCKRGKDHG